MFESLFQSKDSVKKTKEVMANLVLASKAAKSKEEGEMVLVAERLRPSRQHPVIYYYDGKYWVCAYSYTFEGYPPEVPEELNMGATPYGMGNTPEEAARAFDKLWSGADA